MNHTSLAKKRQVGLMLLSTIHLGNTRSEDTYHFLCLVWTPKCVML